MLTSSRVAGKFGITAELWAGPDRSLSRAWAQAARRDGWWALYSGASHDPSGSLRSVSLFDHAGAHQPSHAGRWRWTGQRIDGDKSVEAALNRYGVHRARTGSTSVVPTQPLRSNMTHLIATPIPMQNIPIESRQPGGRFVVRQVFAPTRSPPLHGMTICLGSPTRHGVDQPAFSRSRPAHRKSSSRPGGQPSLQRFAKTRSFFRSPGDEDRRAHFPTFGLQVDEVVHVAMQCRVD